MHPHGEFEVENQPGQSGIFTVVQDSAIQPDTLRNV